jgi:hypothetical protein
MFHELIPSNKAIKIPQCPVTQSTCLNTFCSFRQPSLIAPLSTLSRVFFVFQQKHGQRASNRTSFNSKLEGVEHRKHSARRVLFGCFIPAFDGAAFEVIETVLKKTKEKMKKRSGPSLQNSRPLKKPNHDESVCIFVLFRFTWFIV